MSDAPPDPVTGTWHIVETTLPFWRRRTSPSVSYLPLPDGRVLDAVHYRSRGSGRLVLGADTPAPDGALEADPAFAGSVPALFAPPRIPS